MAQALLPVMVALLLFIYCIIAIHQESQHTRQHRLRVQKLYASPVFKDLSPILILAKKRPVEQLTVDKTGILISYLTPNGSHTAFIMKNYGYAYMTLAQQEAMLTLLEECLPKLKDTKRYRLSNKRIRMVNGDIEYMFRYTMRNGYKAQLSRAPYYDVTLQAGLR